jgi:hypothetical protein
MFGWHGAGQFSIRPDSSRPFASPVQQVPVQRRASLGQLESRILSVGRDLLQGASRQGQQGHACALGQRWLKIVWKMWQTRTLYDADLHARNQIKHGSWVLQLVNKADASPKT